MFITRFYSLLLFTILFCFSSASFARIDSLILIDQDVRIEVPLSDIRQQANTEFVIFAPFRNKEVRMKGIFLEALIKKYLGKEPAHIKLYAVDGYDINFDKWKKNHWVVVTHEDDKPLTLRQQGPLRVVEIDVGNKKVSNLRNFNDWIWMLDKIEIQP